MEQIKQSNETPTEPSDLIRKFHGKCRGSGLTVHFLPKQVL